MKKKKPSAARNIAKVPARTIKSPVQNLLWGRAAGRCQFGGCNKPLWKSPTTQESVVIAEKAHVYSFSPGGARGNKGIAKHQLNEIANLILVCHDCHKTIDADKRGDKYSAATLLKWKIDHETRVEVAAGISPEKRSHVLLFRATVGAQDRSLGFRDPAYAMFPEWYPADDRPIQLDIIDAGDKDDDSKYWEIQQRNLEHKFRQRVSERIARDDIAHVSVFAIAPQPLLILLGSLMTELTAAEVYQLHREPVASWRWPAGGSTQLNLQVQEPDSMSGPPALVLALSASVHESRVYAALPDATIWKVAVPAPSNDLMKSRQQLSEFRAGLGRLLDRIKEWHGEHQPLHVFPVLGVAMAVELGRVRMPKAHSPWIIYDQNVSLGGFVRTITVGGESKHE